MTDYFSNKQIAEAYLAIYNKNLFESKHNDDESLADKFINQITSLIGINEGNDKPFITKEELQDLKNQMNTPDDMERYLEDNKDNIQKFFKKCEENGQSRLAKFAKCTFKVLWTILKYGVPFVWRNKGTVLVLILYFAVCSKLGMSPWSSAGNLFDLTWETGKTVIDAAVKINNGVDSYLGTSEKVGDKVGEVIGTAVQKMRDLF